MSLVVDQRPLLQGNPGVHALIVGVSSYPYLSGGELYGSSIDGFLGFQQLSSAASTGLLFYQWLTQHHDKFLVPLATCRLLLAPSPEELAQFANLPDYYGEPTIENFVRDCSEWRRDAASHQDNITLFYFVGHGFEVNRANPVIMLKDVGDGIGPALRGVVTVSNIFGGMAPMTFQPKIARTQLYFIDSSRAYPHSLRNFQYWSTSDIFDIEISGIDDRSAAIFSATTSGAQAYARKDKQTLFSEALLDCLNGAASEPVEDGEGHEKWQITVQSLTSILPKIMKKVTKELDVLEQEVEVSGLIKNKPLIILDAPPNVELTLDVDQKDSNKLLQIEIKDTFGEPAFNQSVPAELFPIKTNLPAGFYTFHIKSDPPNPADDINKQKIRLVSPPTHYFKIKIDS